WSVLVNYRDARDAAEETAAAVRRSGGRALPWQADSTREDEVAGMFEAAAAQLGPVNAVVVNAGIVAPASSLADMELDRMRRMFEVNVLGSYICAREAARRLPLSRGGPGGA